MDNKPPETQNGPGALKLVETAVDREHFFRTVTHRLETAINPSAKYVGIADVAETINKRTIDAPDVALNIIITIAKTRGMKPGELLALTACLDDQFYGDGSDGLTGIPPEKQTVINELMMKDPVLAPDLNTQIQQSAAESNITPVKLIKKYGIQKAKDAAAVHDQGRSGLKAEILQDIQSDNPPQIRRIKSQSEKEMAAIRAKMPSAQTNKVESNKIPVNLPSKEKQAADLAATMKIDWEEIPAEEQTRLLSLKTEELYVALAKMSPAGQEGMKTMADLEAKHKQKLEEINDQYAKQNDELNKKWEQTQRDIEAKKQQRMAELRASLQREAQTIGVDHQKQERLLEIESQIFQQTGEVYAQYLGRTLPPERQVMLKAGLDYMENTFALTGTDAFRVLAANVLTAQVYRENGDIIETAEEAREKYVVPRKLAETSVTKKGLPPGADRTSRVTTVHSALVKASITPEHAVNAWLKYKKG